MDVRFDSNAAKALLQAMNEYCSSIQVSARDLIALTHETNGWNDKQYKQFSSNVYQLCKDLEALLKVQGDYMNLFRARIEELMR